MEEHRRLRAANSAQAAIRLPAELPHDRRLLRIPRRRHPAPMTTGPSALERSLQVEADLREKGKGSPVHEAELRRVADARIADIHAGIALEAELAAKEA